MAVCDPQREQISHPALAVGRAVGKFLNTEAWCGQFTLAAFDMTLEVGRGIVPTGTNNRVGCAMNNMG